MPRRVRGFNPPPGWPEPPHPGWWPPAGWEPSPDWPEPPDDWEWWREQELPAFRGHLRTMKRWQKLALVGVCLVPVVTMGQAFVRTALIPGAPGYFTSVEYRDGYQVGWKYAEAHQGETFCTADIDAMPDYDEDIQECDWADGYLKGCFDARKS